MSINIRIPKDPKTPELKPRITVIGVGGAGGNAVNNMIDQQLEGVEFLVANTDAQALANSRAESRIQLGAGVTQGLGAGSHPEIGRQAAEETIAEIADGLEHSNMLFIAAGMGGGTGTGGAPVIAKLAKERGILTVGVVTKPFQFEGAHRMKLAENGIEDLEQFVDTLIVIPNQNLFRIANEQTTFADAFNMADQVLYSGVRGVTDLMVMPGLINLDFADIRSVMTEMGKAMMGTGEAEGERRALDAAEAAIANPLLDDTSMAGAKGVLINITGGQDMTLFETDEAANRIRSEVDDDAYIIFGSTFDDSLEGRIRVSIVATGMDRAAIAAPSMTFLSIDTPVRAKTAAAAEEEVETPEIPSIVELAGLATAGAEEDDDALSIPGPEAEAGEAVDEPGTETAAEAEIPDMETAEQPSARGPDRQPTSTDVDPGEAVPASPGSNAADAFIPPPPATADGAEEPATADPYAAAAMVNGSTAGSTAGAGAIESKAAKKGASRKPSLFEMVTGIGNAGPDKPEPIEPTLDAAEPSLKLAAAAPEPEAEDSGETGHASGGQPDEDLLDIPAFLRRQAN